MSTPQPLRILCLHGYTQTSTLFHAKTRALHKALLKAFPHPKYDLRLSYPQGPTRLTVADIPGYADSTTTASPNDGSVGEEEVDAYGWWRRKDYDLKSGETDIVYEGMEAGLEVIGKCIREEGPFDGVVGFSQGACAAGLVASLLEGARRREAFDRLEEKKGGMAFPRCFLEEEGGNGVGGFVQGPLKFAVLYSGFRAPGRRYAAFYEPGVETLGLHVLGQVDVVVEEARARLLVDAWEGGRGRVVVHPGGHFVPSQKPWLDALVGFVKECVDGKKIKEIEEVKVEEMEMPF